MNGKLSTANPGHDACSYPENLFGIALTKKASSSFSIESGHFPKKINGSVEAESASIKADRCRGNSG